MAPSDDELRENARRVWALGDYAPIARRLEPAAELLVEAADVREDHDVLDVAAGTGNVALMAYERGAKVTASDIAPAMVERGRARTAGLGIDWVEADAEELPFPDASFDRVLSAFGVIFAPHPERAAAELMRVVRPGGVVALTAWGRYGLQASILEAIGSILPMPASGAPEEWGDPDIARERLGPHATQIHTEVRALEWHFASAADWLEFMWEHAPPMLAMRAVLQPDQVEPMRAALIEAIRAHGREDRGDFVVEPQYQLVVARR